MLEQHDTSSSWSELGIKHWFSLRGWWSTKFLRLLNWIYDVVDEVTLHSATSSSSSSLNLLRLFRTASVAASAMARVRTPTSSSSITAIPSTVLHFLLIIEENKTEINHLFLFFFFERSFSGLVTFFLWWWCWWWAGWNNERWGLVLRF